MLIILERFRAVQVFSLAINFMPSISHTASTTSPFWRSRPAAPRRVASSSADPNKVIGASYSYADMLNMEAMYVSHIVLYAEFS